MTKTQVPQAGRALGTREARAHVRRKLTPLAYVELGQDNGGILLDLGEGGFAVQSALALQATEFPELRFQVPHVPGWLNASGQIAWISESKKVAGIRFLNLPERVRLEITKWLSAKGEPSAEVREGSLEPVSTISDSSYRGDPRAQMSNHAGLQPKAQPLPAATQGAAASSSSEVAPDFRFNEYSMFAPSQEETWIEPRERKSGSRRVALLLMLMATLCFVLWATVGRSAVDSWIGYIAAWRQGPDAPNVTTSAPPDDPNRVAPDTKETDRQQVSIPSGGQGGDAQQAQTGTPVAEQAGAENAAADGQHVDDKASQARATKETSLQQSTREEVDEAAGIRGGSSSAAPKRPAKVVTPSRNAIVAKETENTPLWEHSILVTAPEPGSPPFLANLPGEAVSASSSVAISERRTIQVPPRVGPGYAQSERVVIGKLVSHGEPFYPAEAISKRLEGGVEVRATIGRTGQVLAVRPLRGSPLLASAAMAAVREWRYEPTFLNGDPIETQAEITIVFRLP